MLGLACGCWLGVLGHAGHALALVEAVYLAGLELTLVTAIAVLFSALSTPVLSSLYTLGAVPRRAVVRRPARVRQHAPGRAASPMLETVANLVPNLPLFNMRTLAVGWRGAPRRRTSALATLYAALYCGCVLVLAAAAFESRDFK